MELYASAAALIISLISLYFSARAFYRDRGKIEIVSIDFHHPGNGGSHFLVTAVNSGRRPVYLERAQLKTRSGGRYTEYFSHVSSHGFAFRAPQEFLEGQKYAVRFEIYKLESDGAGGMTPSSQVAINPLEIVGAEIVDTTGKKYKRKLSRAEKRAIASQWKYEI